MSPATSRASRPDWPEDRSPGSYSSLLAARQFRHTFRWLQLRTLRESRNDLLERLIKSAKTEIDLVDDERQRWTAAQRAAGVDSNCIALTGLKSFSFAVLGDTGEADESQYCVVRPLEAAIRDTTFALIMSDVIYPTGETNDYLDGFYLPYRFYDRPIYAIPGNHDWYSLLTGFMWNFCDAEPLPRTTYRLSSYTWQERLARTFWLQARAPLRARLLQARDRRPPWNDARPSWPGWLADRGGWPRQPGPYYAIDTECIRLVCIDTGISGDLDAEQGEWLLHVSSESPLHKILVTGKPLYVNSYRQPSAIHWGAELDGGNPDADHHRFPDVDSIVREPAHNYVAAIGGDVHNYQRYPVTIDDGQGRRVLQCIVSGGGGAFLSPTHPIPRIQIPDLPDGVTAPTEDEFRCYPLRGDSLARFSIEFGRQIPRIFVATLCLAVVLGIAGAALLLPHTSYDARWPAVGLAIVAAGVTLLLVVGDWFRLHVRLALIAAGAVIVVVLGLWPRWGVAVDAGLPFAGVAVVAIVGFKRWKVGLAAFAVAVAAVLLMVMLHGTVYGLLRAWVWTIGAAAMVTALLYLLPLTLATVRGRPIDPDACSRYIGDRLSIDPHRKRARSWGLGRLTRLRLWITFPTLPFGPIYAPLLYSALFDFGTPPFFKNFLHVKCDADGVTVLVYAVTGFRVHEQAPRVEDSFRWRAADNRWTTARAVVQRDSDAQPHASIDFFRHGGGGTFEVDLGSGFTPGRYSLAAKRNFGDSEVVRLGTVDATTSPFELAVDDLAPPPRGWFQEIHVDRDGVNAGTFAFT